MQGIDDFLIKVDSKYKSTISFNNQTLMLTSFMEDPFQLHKSATVLKAPLKNNGIEAEEGDTIFFSHLVLRENFGVQNVKVPSDYLVDATENIYRVPPRLIYAYIHKDEFKVVSPFIFIRPVKEKDKVTPAGIILPGNDKEIKHLGEVAYTTVNSPYKKGDYIIFSKNSEYEIKVMGERLYRMKEEWIVCEYEK